MDNSSINNLFEKTKASFNEMLQQNPEFLDLKVTSATITNKSVSVCYYHNYLEAPHIAVSLELFSKHDKTGEYICIFNMEHSVVEDFFNLISDQ